MSVFVLLCIAVGAFTLLMFGLTIALDIDAPGYWGIAGLAVLIVLGLLAVVIYPSRAVGRTTCRHFSAQTGYRTKFVVLSWNDTGTCLAQMPNGRWTKNTRIIANVPTKP